MAKSIETIHRIQRNKPYACNKSMHYEKRTIEKLRDSPLLISYEYIWGEKTKNTKEEKKEDV